MKIRLQITKDREIRFVSHLDYLRALERSLRRAGWPVAYSEGFNPRMKFSLASALGVGVVSRTEFVEIELAEPLPLDEAIAALRRALPRGIRIVDGDCVATEEPALMASVAGADYRVRLACADVAEQVARFNQADALLYKKAAPKRKEGYKEVDLKRYVTKIDYAWAEGQGEFRFNVLISPEGSVKATDVLAALGLDAANADVERLAMYRAGGKPVLHQGRQ